MTRRDLTLFAIAFVFALAGLITSVHRVYHPKGADTMITRDGGGPAFPTEWPAKTHEDGSESAPAMMECGMSLRDWFAGQALTGLMADPEDGAFTNTDAKGYAKAVASTAYRFADAMLAVREKAEREEPTP